VISTKKTHFLFRDFVSAVGGSFATYTLVFITIPAALFIDKEFLTYITKHLLEAEKCKRSRLKIKGEEPDLASIRKKYLKRVSHEGIYNIHDTVETIKQRNAVSVKKLEEEN
jgi:hypothetical protein